MNGLLHALQFLTIIPLKPGRFSSHSLGASVIYFPLVGALIGGSAALAAWFIRSVLDFPGVTASACAVVCLAAVSGGLHLDGLADTFDALGSRKDRAGMLEVMRDSRIGAFGAVAIGCVLMAKAAGLCGYAGNQMIRALVLLPLISRWACGAVLFLFPAARDAGSAVSFKDGLSAKAAGMSTLITAVAALAVGGTAGLALAACAGLFAVVSGKCFARMFGGVTGDTVGAVCELTEVMLVLCALPFMKAY